MILFVVNKVLHMIKKKSVWLSFITKIEMFNIEQKTTKNIIILE